MKLLCSEALKVLAKSVLVTLPDLFTGCVTIRLNFHLGIFKTASVGFEEGERFDR